MTVRFNRLLFSSRSSHILCAFSQILIRNRATELDSRMNDGTTPLILAARLAVEGMVEELIHCHADINAVDDHGKTLYIFTFTHTGKLENAYQWVKLAWLVGEGVIWGGALSFITDVLERNT